VKFEVGTSSGERLSVYDIKPGQISFCEVNQDSKNRNTSHGVK
jgi:hypothetical protein